MFDVFPKYYASGNFEGEYDFEIKVCAMKFFLGSTLTKGLHT